jgi:transcriptional regulator with XRE-family HTH domain
MLTAEQCRAGRAWLNLTQSELAEKAGIGLSTLRAFEAGTRAPIRANLNALRHSLEAAGVQFVFGEDGRATGITIDAGNASQSSPGGNIGGSGKASGNRRP